VKRAVQGSRIRVLNVFPDFGIGGMQRQCADRINLMPQHFDHQIVALNGDLRMTAALTRPDTTPIIDAPRRQPGRPYCVTLVPWLRAQRPDLLLTYGWGSTDVIVAARFAGIRRLIHAQHGFGPLELTRQLRRRLWVRRLLFRRISRLVVPSTTLRAIAQQLWRVPERRIAFIPSGVDTQRFQSGDGTAIRARLGIPPGAVVVGTVGRLDEEKDPEVLIDLLAALDSGADVHAVFVGEGSRRAAVADRAARLGLGSRVHFPGFSADPSEYYRAFDVFVLTSRTEQRPLSLLEAMACGLPVVCTRVGDVIDMVAPAQRALVVSLGDRSALTQAVDRLVRSAEMRRQLGNGNQRHCHQHFDIHEVVARYGRLYEEVLADTA